MLNLEYGVGPTDERRYQEWLSRYTGGLVLSLNPGRDGRWSLHAPSCDTLSYPLPERQSQRTGKVCCENTGELEEWCSGKGVPIGDLNRCSRCLGGRAV